MTRPSRNKSANSIFDNFRDSDLNVGAQLDAANRLRVSQPTTQIDIKQFNDNQPLFYDRENIGGATQVYAKANGGATMSVSSNNDAAICQSKMFASYFSGKSQIMEITFSDMDLEVDVVKRAGYFSSNTATPFDSNKDGIWLEASDNDYHLVIEKNGVELLRQARGQWDHPLDPELDLSKFNVFVLQFLYLGGTAVRFGFIHKGRVFWVYTYVHAGAIASTFVESPNQPIRYEIRSTGGAGSFDQICAEVSSEGTVDPVGAPQGYSAHDFQADVADTIYAVLGIRLKSDYRNIRIDIDSLSFQAENNDDFLWLLLLNPTIAGTAPSFGDTDDIGTIENAATEVAIGVTANTVATNTMGKRLGNGSVEATTSSTDKVDSSLRLGSNIDGSLDELWLCVRPRTAGLDVDVSINIQEFI